MTSDDQPPLSSEEDVRKILGGNLLRVWRAVEAAAES